MWLWQGLVTCWGSGVQTSGSEHQGWWHHCPSCSPPLSLYLVISLGHEIVQRAFRGLGGDPPPGSVQRDGGFPTCLSVGVGLRVTPHCFLLGGSGTVLSH